jgi:hypothetical protein
MPNTGRNHHGCHGCDRVQQTIQLNRSPCVAFKHDVDLRLFQVVMTFCIAADLSQMHCPWVVVSVREGPPSGPAWTGNRWQAAQIDDLGWGRHSMTWGGEDTRLKTALKRGWRLKRAVRAGSSEFGQPLLVGGLVASGRRLIAPSVSLYRLLGLRHAQVSRIAGCAVARLFLLNR